MGVKENMKLMMTLDDAWNNQDWETFSARALADAFTIPPSTQRTLGGGPFSLAKSLL